MRFILSLAVVLTFGIAVVSAFASFFTLPATEAEAFEFDSAPSWFSLGRKAPPLDPDARMIAWDDLAPSLTPEQKAAAAELNARIDMMTDEEIAKAMAKIEENGNEVVEALDGEKVAINGYLLPLDYEATEATEFVLVPFIGACIHVPPPPPNQVVFVRFEKGLPMKALEANLWTPFRATGVLHTATARTELAETGYQMTASDIVEIEL